MTNPEGRKATGSVARAKGRPRPIYQRRRVLTDLADNLRLGHLFID